MANKSTIEFINPYASLAQKHKDGLDFVINAITTASPPYTDLSAEELLEIVVDYLQDAYDIADTEVQWLDAITTALANTVNTYLDGSAASTASALGLFSVPVGSLANHIERLEERTTAARSINGPMASNQLSLTFAKADFEYWNVVVNASPLGDWEPYLNGNVAIDTASIPYWIEASVIGSASGYNQIKGTDGSVALTHALTALGGSIMVAAGKVIFGWVAKTPSDDPIITDVSEGNCCDNGVKAMSGAGGLSGVGHPGGTAMNSTTTYLQPVSGRTGTDFRTFHGKKYLCTFIDYGPTFGPHCPQ